MQGEEIVHEGQVHWIVYLKAVFMLVMSLWMYSGGSELAGIATFFLAIAALLWIVSAIQVQGSEFAVTNRRVLAKTGILSRVSLDMNLDKAEPLAFRMSVQDQTDQRTRTPPAVPAPGGREERECPYCAEPILKKARICKHCGRDVGMAQP